MLTAVRSLMVRLLNRVLGRSPGARDRQASAYKAPTTEEARAVLKAGLADYEWGSGQIWFADFSGATHLTPATAVLDLMQGTGEWETNLQFRQKVLFLHEYVHYLQDVATGVGHWDFLKRRSAFAQLLGRSAIGPRGESLLPDDKEALERRYHAAYLGSLFNTGPGTHSKDLDQRIVGLARHYGWEPAEIFPAMFSVESLLETEAVLQSFVSLSRMSFNEKSAAVLDASRKLFDPLHMSGIYNDLCRFILLHVGHVMGVNDLAALVKELGTNNMHLAQVYHQYILLLDISCSYPPPSFDMGTLSPIDFEPGVRLMRLMKALQGEWLQEGEEIEGPHDFEQKLLRACDTPYPTSSSIYLSWIDHLNGDASLQGDPVLQARVDLSMEKAHSKHAFSKIPNGTAAPRFPVFFAIESHKKTYTHAIDKHKAAYSIEDLGHAFNWDAIFIDLIESYYLKKAFTCPVTTNCPVCREDCVNGYPQPSDVPDDDRCVVRQFFASGGLIEARAHPTKGASNDNAHDRGTS
jgi:hypothetical protein